MKSCHLARYSFRVFLTFSLVVLFMSSVRLARYLSMPSVSSSLGRLAKDSARDFRKSAFSATVWPRLVMDSERAFDSSSWPCFRPDS